MIAEIAADEFVLVRVSALLEILAREFHRRLHRLRSTRERLNEIQVAGRNFADPLNEVERDIRGAVHRRREAHPVELPLDRLKHPRMAVAQVGDKDPANRVEITPALGVPVVQALGFGHHDRVGEERLGRLVVHKCPPQQALLPLVELHAITPGRMLARSARRPGPPAPVLLPALAHPGYGHRSRTGRGSAPESPPAP